MPRRTPTRDLIRPHLATPTSAATIAALVGHSTENIRQTLKKWRESDPDHAPRIAAWERSSGGPHIPLYAINPKRKTDARPLKNLSRQEIMRRYRTKRVAEIRISERKSRDVHRTPTWLLPLIFSQSAVACASSK